MSFASAFLGFLGAVFLPGAVVYRLILGRLGRQDLGEIAIFIVASFVLSLAVNFYLIYALVGLGIYVRGVVLAILGVEFWRFCGFIGVKFLAKSPWVKFSLILILTPKSRPFR